MRSHVISETVFTPIDFEKEYNAKFGTAFGLMPTLAQSNYYDHRTFQEITKIYILQEQAHIQELVYPSCLQVLRLQ